MLQDFQTWLSSARGLTAELERALSHTSTSHTQQAAIGHPQQTGQASAIRLPMQWLNGRCPGAPALACRCIER